MRLNYMQYLEKEVGLLTEIEKLVDASSLDLNLLELVKLRVSQMNGCSFCVKYHTTRLRMNGEENARIDMVATWREAPILSAREKAAMQWAEALTLVADTKEVDDALYDASLKEFGEEGLSQLTLAISMINVWNRLAISFQTDHQFVEQLLGVAKS